MNFHKLSINVGAHLFMVNYMIIICFEKPSRELFQTTRTTNNNEKQLYFNTNYHELSINVGAHLFMVNYMVIIC